MPDEGSETRYAPLVNAVHRVSKLLAYLVGIATLLVAFLIVYEVIVRNLGQSTSLATEISIYLLPGIAFLANGYGMDTRTHIHMNLFTSRLSKPRWLIVHRAHQVLLLPIAALLAIGGVILCWTSYTNSILSPGVLRIPLWLPQLTVPICGVAMLGSIAAQLVEPIFEDASHVVAD